MGRQHDFRRTMAAAAVAIVLAASIAGCATRPRPSADAGGVAAVSDSTGGAPASGIDAPASGGVAGSAAGPAAMPEGASGFGVGGSAAGGTFRDAADAQRALELQASDRVFFDFDSARIRPDAAITLQRQAGFLSAHRELRVQVAGHADERGTRDYNLALGARRASATRDYLIALGIAPTRISIVSYGKERPIDPRPNEAGWARNRNAHTVIIE